MHVESCGMGGFWDDILPSITKAGTDIIGAVRGGGSTAPSFNTAAQLPPRDTGGPDLTIPLMIGAGILLFMLVRKL